MRITTEQHERKHYECDIEGCTFSSYDEYEVKRHHASQHAIRERKHAGDADLMRFETQEDFDIWHSYHGMGDRPHGGVWSGPGWYAQVRAKNGYGEWQVWAVSVGAYMNEQERELHELIENIRALRRFCKGT